MDHGHGMDGMGMKMTPPQSSSSSSTSNMDMPHKMMMHMTFFWGKNAEILYQDWPGTRSGMYVLALVFVFVLAVLIEWLSHSRLIKPGSNQVAGLIQTFLHAIRIGLAYMVMLAVMSFNIGVFLAAIFGHTIGFFFFGSRFFKNPDIEKISSELPPMSC